MKCQNDITGFCVEYNEDTYALLCDKECINYKKKKPKKQCSNCKWRDLREEDKKWKKKKRER